MYNKGKTIKSIEMFISSFLPLNAIIVVDDSLIKANWKLQRNRSRKDRKTFLGNEKGLSLSGSGSRSNRSGIS